MTDPQEHRAPDVVSHDPTEPPPQPPTQPSIEARPDLLPPAHPPQTSPPVPPPGLYAQPMPMPPKRNRTGTLLLVIVVAVLMIGGGTAGYLLLGDTGEEAQTAAADESTEAAPGESAPAEETSPAFEFPGETIPVASLGAEMPVPSANWELQAGPGEEGADIADMASYVIQYDENWYANILVGRYDVAGLPFEPESMAATAAELTGFWAEQSAAGGENGTTTRAASTMVTVDGREGVIAEATASWDATGFSADKYERVITFLVDVDGVNAFYVQAWIPESADAEYEAVVAALQATTFTG